MKTYYRKKHLQLMEPWFDGKNIDGVSISITDRLNGSPRYGDMIAINQSNTADRWLVAEEFFLENYELAI